MGSDRIGRAAEGNEERERSSLAKLDNRADDPAVAEREWRMDEAGQKGTKREQCCPGIIFCLLRQTNHPLGTTSVPSTPDLSPVFRSGAAITSASLCDAH